MRAHRCARVLQSSVSKRPTSISVLFGGTKIALIRRPWPAATVGHSVAYILSVAYRHVECQNNRVNIVRAGVQACARVCGRCARACFDGSPKYLRGAARSGAIGLRIHHGLAVARRHDFDRDGVVPCSAVGCVG